MAKRLGLSLNGYRRWEYGTTSPRAKSLLKLIALCPNAETRAAFGVKFETANLHGKAHLTAADEERLRYYNDAVTGVNLLYEAAQAGHKGAWETLRYLADIINKHAGDWRRMKYSKLK